MSTKDRNPVPRHAASQAATSPPVISNSQRGSKRTAGLVILLLGVVTLVLNGQRWLDDFSMIKPAGTDLVSILRSDVDGNSALLGVLLKKHYPETITFHFPAKESEKGKKYFGHFRFRSSHIEEFAYPISIVRTKYNCFVAEDEIRDLIQRAFRSERANNLTYYLVREGRPDAAMGISIYGNAFVVSPRKQR